MSSFRGNDCAPVSGIFVTTKTMTIIYNAGVYVHVLSTCLSVHPFSSLFRRKLHNIYTDKQRRFLFSPLSLRSRRLSPFLYYYSFLKALPFIGLLLCEHQRGLKLHHLQMINHEKTMAGKRKTMKTTELKSSRQRHVLMKVGYREYAKLGVKTPKLSKGRNITSTLFPCLITRFRKALVQCELKRIRISGDRISDNLSRICEKQCRILKAH